MVPLLGRQAFEDSPRRGADAKGSPDVGGRTERAKFTLAPVSLRRGRTGDHQMSIAMNRFKVIKGSETDFENVWLSRDTHLEKVPGFVEFHLLKGPEVEDHTLYASHTVWKNRATFDALTIRGLPCRACPRRRK